MGSGSPPRAAGSLRQGWKCFWHRQAGATPRSAGHASNFPARSPTASAKEDGRLLTGRRFPAAAAAAPAACAGPRRASGGAATMARVKVWALAGLLLCGLQFLGLEAFKASKRPMRTRACADRPEELLEQLYGRLTAGMLSAFHHTLQLEPLEKEHNVTCPTGSRASVDKKYRLPINLNSVSPWSYRISYDPTRYPKYIPEAYCLCKGCLTGVYGEENFHFRSIPVYMPTVILRRTTSCTGGRYVYTEDYVTVPVGCTCIPEHDKEADGVNSSIDKQAAKLLGTHNDKPASE